MKRRIKDESIGASQLPPTTAIQDETKKSELPEPRDMSQFLGLAAEIAQDTAYIRHTRIPNGTAHFPNDPLMRTVEKYFVSAVGGPLYVDEPRTKRDIEECLVKREVMKKEKCRYVYISPDMDYDDVIAQLGDTTRGVA